MHGWVRDPLSDDISVWVCCVCVCIWVWVPLSSLSMADKGVNWGVCLHFSSQTATVYIFSLPKAAPCAVLWLPRLDVGIVKAFVKADALKHLRKGEDKERTRPGEREWESEQRKRDAMLMNWKHGGDVLACFAPWLLSKRLSLSTLCENIQHSSALDWWGLHSDGGNEAGLKMAIWYRPKAVIWISPMEPTASDKPWPI